MKTLKMNNLMRNLTLVAAGAFMATLVVLPVTSSADHNEDRETIEATPVATYTLGASDGTSSVFTLVESDGNMVLTLVEEPEVRNINHDDD